MAAADGTAFDRMFLQMMIRHHQGAIEMAAAEKANGINPAAKQLADNIATSQAEEVKTMQKLLNSL